MNTSTLFPAVDLHQFGVRRAVRMAASARGTDYRAGEQAAMNHLRAHGNRGEALYVGLNVVCPEPAESEVY